MSPKPCTPCAVGPVDAAGAVQYHPLDGRAAGAINYATGASREVATVSAHHDLQVRAEGIRVQGLWPPSARTATCRWGLRSRAQGLEVRD